MARVEARKSSRLSRRATERRLPPLGDPLDRPIALEIRDRIEAAKKILIMGHERPDGDCLGSTIALGEILRGLGRNVQVISAEPVPERLRFLESAPIQYIAKTGEKLEGDLAIVLDSTGLDRLGGIKREMFADAPIINIDHHISNENFGEINWVDSTAAATGELIWRLAACCGWSVPSLALEGLYTALVTDTGQFAYSNTSARILRMAAELVEAGVDSEATWRRIFLNKTEAELKLEAVARNSMEVRGNGRIAAITLRHRDFLATGTGPEATQEFTGIPRALSGAMLAIFFYEITEDKLTKISIRSTREVDACALAKQFGGGGHRQAAGCSLAMTVDEAKKTFFAAAEKAVEELPPKNGQ
ncbi:MAG: bifunctional oligoribonuclease/PAP phosphatase NrnA [Planctomycetota bacterium]|nr:bifunctional oligoribonuclease/PAP phosphatase NrnA [Planctomycetota bacterium]